MKSAV